MKDLLTYLSSRFDVIIENTPPLLTVSDALVLAYAIDVILLVTSTGETHWGALERATKMMRDAGIKPKGVILNRIDMNRPFGRYGYGCGSRCGYGYGYGADSGLYADLDMQSIIQKS